MSTIFDWITCAWIPGPDADFANHIGRQIAISVVSMDTSSSPTADR